MELDWFTFALEIINFLVLVWVLKRFLYRPILQTIAKRQTAIAQALSEATAAKTDAEALERQYRDRVTEWEREKDKLRAQAVEDVSAERTRLMAALRDELDQRREKERVIEQRRSDDMRRQLEEAAVAQGALFAGRILSRVAAPDLEGRILELVLEDIADLADDQLQALKSAALDAGSKMKVTSAFPLESPQREALVRGIGRAVNTRFVGDFHEDPALLAGLRISVGPWVLRANLRDELAWFGETTRRGG